MAYKNWKLEDLKEGIDRFFKENGRFPTVNDIDKSSYLPSTRWIQIKFGGIIRVREVLGYQDLNFGAGLYRTAIAKQVNNAGLIYEHEIERFLVDKFGEEFVHIQRRVGEGRNRLDFYVYNSTGDFGVDVTTITGLFRNLQTNINIKISRYKHLKTDLFVVIGGNFDQAQIDTWILKKVAPLPDRWRIFTTANFIQYIDQFKPYVISK